jgi:hypothetical protein
MPPRLGIIDAEDEHHSTSCLHYPAAAPKMMPPQGKATPKAPSSSDPGNPDLGFPLEQHEQVDAGCDDDAFNKLPTPGRHHRPPRQKFKIGFH